MSAHKIVSIINTGELVVVSRYCCLKLGIQCDTPRDSPHAARYNCSKCNKWIGWAKNKALTELVDINNERIIRMLGTDYWNTTERSFLESMQNNRWITKERVEWLNTLYRRFENSNE